MMCNYMYVRMSDTIIITLIFGVPAALSGANSQLSVVEPEMRIFVEFI